MKKLVLSQGRLIDAPLHYEASDWRKVMRRQKGWMPVKVPVSVYEALREVGKIEEPLTGLNFQSCGWVAERSWWLRFSLMTSASDLEQDAIILALGGPDFGADVMINGEWVGRHDNAFRPFDCDVKSWLKADAENTLLLRLTTGTELLPDPAERGFYAFGEEGRGFPERGEPGRWALRKPQYVWGWDRGPRLPTCGVATMRTNGI